MKPDLGNIGHSVRSELCDGLSVRIMRLHIPAGFPKHPLEVREQRVLQLNEVVELWLIHKLVLEQPTLVLGDSHERGGSAYLPKEVFRLLEKRDQ